MTEARRAAGVTAPPIDRATAAPRCRPPAHYSLSLTASDCSDLLASNPLMGRADPRSGRNNHDVGTMGDLLTIEGSRLRATGLAWQREPVLRAGSRARNRVT
jgi:hypothetical protein